MDYCWLYITFPTGPTAKEVAKILVEEKLVACANILGPVTSIFEWEGKVQEEQEIIMTAKTRKKLFPEIEKKVKTLHPYSCPCLVTFPIEQGSEQFLQWITQQTEKS